MFSLTINDADFLNSLDVGGMEADIFNDARSQPSPSGRWGGYAYYWPVNLGRGPVNPIYAKALRIVLPDGTVIFRKHAGPSAARDILGKSAAQLESSAINAVATSGGVGYGSSVRRWFATFLTKFAYFQAQVMADATPNGPGGKLASSYRSTVAT
jgi:hypothetical protein